MEYIPLTDELIAIFKAHQKRTGIGPQRLLKGRKDCPDGLSSALYYGWIRGLLGTARRDHVEWFLRLYEQADELVPLTADVISELESHRTRTGVEPLGIARRASETAAHLTPQKISSMLRGRTHKVSKKDLTLITEIWAALPDKIPSN